MTSKAIDIPLVQCLEVCAEEPSLQDNTADVDRLKSAVQEVLREKGQGNLLCRVPIKALQQVADGFRQNGFRGGALVNYLPGCVEIVDFVPDSRKPVLAMALDLGTTHLEATLLDLATGETVASAHALNQQVDFGTDILSRIHHAVRVGSGKTLDLSGLAELQQVVTASINGLAADLAQKAGVDSTDIRALSVSGNTTMVHLFLGVSPYHICREPYIPLVNAPDLCYASELGLCLSPLAPVFLLPSIGSYFGGDLVSGILASGLDEAEATQMLIDVGTNAEVILGNKDWLIACAGAAGPALEGGVARMGMRAADGAVEKISIDTENWQLAYRTIENAEAKGICGSGLIDLVAELYLAQLIDFRGKLPASAGNFSGDRGEFLAKRLGQDESGPFFIVVHGKETADGKPVVISQLDIDAMMRSKAAMYAILKTLTSQVGVEFDQLAGIYVAGAFGKHIDPGHAITLGMIPDLPLSTYSSIGNSSLRGAEMVLLSENSRSRCLDIRRKITYLELNVNQEFMIRFSGSRVIPHTDPQLFPSVPVFQNDANTR